MSSEILKKKSNCLRNTSLNIFARIQFAYRFANKKVSQLVRNRPPTRRDRRPRTIRKSKNDRSRHRTALSTGFDCARERLVIIEKVTGRKVSHSRRNFHEVYTWCRFFTSRSHFLHSATLVDSSTPCDIDVSFWRLRM